MAPVQHAPTSAGAAAGRRTFLATAWPPTSATLGALQGLVPHVLHHVDGHPRMAFGHGGISIRGSMGAGGGLARAVVKGAVIHRCGGGVSVD